MHLTYLENILISVSGKYIKNLHCYEFTKRCSHLPLLPSAKVVAERLCFHRCLSVHGGRGGVHPLSRPHSPLGRHPSTRHHTPLARHHTLTPPRPDPTSPWAGPPSSGLTATAADGTHPTGMHSSVLIVSLTYNVYHSCTSLGQIHKT